MRFILLALIALIFTAVAFADDPKPAATQPSSEARTATPIDRDAVIKAMREKEEQEEEEGLAGEPEDPDESPKASEPVVKLVSPERLKTAHNLRANVNVQLLKWVDVDGDGKPELVAPSWNGPIFVYKDLAEEPQEVELDGLDRGSMLSDVCPIPQAKGVRWFVGTRKDGYSGGLFSSPGSSFAALYSETGEKLWQYQLKTPKNYSVEMHVASGDLDGDGAREYVVGVSVQKATSTGRSSWTLTNQKAYVLIFNEQGKQIASRKAGDSIQSVQVVASAKPGEPGLVLVLSYNGIGTYTLLPPKPAATQPAEK